MLGGRRIVVASVGIADNHATYLLDTGDFSVHPIFK